MPKSKVVKAEEEFSGSDVASESEAPNTSKKRQLDDPDEQITKKAKTKQAACGSDLAGASKERQVKALTNSEGEKYIDLGKKKRVTVRSFKGIPLLDIREFYGADGQEKPGKKGISLTLDQWEVLRESASMIDQLFSTQEKK